jgi:adenylate kinase
MNLNTIFFIGPQGSGKGTQAKLLSKHLDFFYWEMGAILRDIAASGSILGDKVKSLIDSGTLLQDEDLYMVIKMRLNEIPITQGVIFDGIPRRLGQAEFLLNFLKEQGRADFTTLYVNLPHDESVTRLLKRGEIEKRADDTKEKIEFRLQQYEKDTVPVLDFLKVNSHFFEIDGRPAVDEVAKEIRTALVL